MHAKFELFITFRYPQNGHFYHAFLRKSKKRGSKLDQKGVKRGEKGRLGLKLLNTWLESLEKMMHAKFQLFITFGYEKKSILKKNPPLLVVPSAAFLPNF